MFNRMLHTAHLLRKSAQVKKQHGYYLSWRQDIQQAQIEYQVSTPDNFRVVETLTLQDIDQYGLKLVDSTIDSIVDAIDRLEERCRL